MNDEELVLFGTHEPGDAKLILEALKGAGIPFAVKLGKGPSFVPAPYSLMCGGGAASRIEIFVRAPDCETASRIRNQALGIM